MIPKAHCVYVSRLVGPVLAFLALISRVIQAGLGTLVLSLCYISGPHLESTAYQQPCLQPSYLNLISDIGIIDTDELQGAALFPSLDSATAALFGQNKRYGRPTIEGVAFSDRCFSLDSISEICKMGDASIAEWKITDGACTHLASVIVTSDRPVLLFIECDRPMTPVERDEH